MTKTYPMEMRERAVKFVEAGESRHAVAVRFGIAASTVIKWLARHAKTGSAASAKMGGYRPRKIAGKYRDWLFERMEAGNFTLQGLAGELEQQGLKVDYKTVWTFVHENGHSFKKTLRAAEQQRPDVARRRALWFRVQPRIDASGFVFIDETRTRTNMAPLHGWSPVGERCVSCVPFATG